MKKYHIGIIGRIAILVGIVEIITFSFFSYLYATKYTSQIQNNLQERLHIIHKMFANEELPISSISRKDYMTNLIGEKYIEGSITGRNQRIIASSQIQYLGKKIEDITHYNNGWIFDNLGEKFYFLDETIISIGHLQNGTNKPMYRTVIFVDAQKVFKAQNEIMILGIIGSLIFAILSSLAIIIFAQRYFTRRINSSLETLKEVEKGNLTARIFIKENDEIGLLQQNINSMIESIKRSNNQLIQDRTFLEKLIDSIPIRVFWKDTKGYYIGANKLFVQDAGLTSIEELVGKNDFELPWKDTEAKNYLEDDQKIIDSKESKLNIKETQTTIDGEVIHLNTSKVPLFDKNGEVSGILGLYENITKNIKAQEIIKAQEMQIVQQNRLAQMGEMIAMIAHQWRQPLTVISSICGLLQLKINQNKYEKVLYEKKLAKITLQTHYLSQTIDDFSNFFKPDKTKKNITSKQLIEDSLKIIEPILLKSNIKIITEYLCQKELYTFPNEVKQVLLNIIKNSQDAFLENDIKEAYIKISTTSSIDSKCTITIEDNAGGIPKNILDKIFDPYFSTKDKNGTGLGLYMSKLIIEDHCDGELSVSSKDGKTTFKLIFTY